MAQNVFPTKNNLMQTKKTLRLARTGYELMDRKRSILMQEIMTLMDEAESIGQEISDIYKEAYDALRLAIVIIGIDEGMHLPVPIDNSLNITVRSVNGVELPTVTIGENENILHYGIENTCRELDTAFFKFNEAKKLTAKYAQIQSNVCRLAEAVKKTQKRTNALGNIMIPKLENTVKFISETLDEREREEFSRLKVIKGPDT